MTNEYLNYLYNYDAQSSGLLGSFDNSDKYSIDETIKQELLKANKQITDYKEDLITANALVGAYKFEFRVLIQLGEKNLKRAGLFLIEKAGQGFYEKEIQTLIHFVVLQNDGAFLNSIKKEFNLYTKDESEGIDMSNSMLTSILKKKGELEVKQKNSVDLLYNLDSEYVKKMLSVLKEYGPIGERLLLDFKTSVSAKHLNKKDKSYWKELKVTLDKIVLSNLTVFDSSTLAKIQAIQATYIAAYKEVKIPLVIETKDAPKKAKSKGGGASKPYVVKEFGIKVTPFVPPSTPTFNFPETKSESKKTLTSGLKIDKNTKAKPNQKVLSKQKEPINKNLDNVSMRTFGRIGKHMNNEKAKVAESGREA